VKDRLETTYTLYLKSDPHKDPVLYKHEATKINYDQRGEYIASYDVDDASGNHHRSASPLSIFPPHSLRLLYHPYSCTFYSRILLPDFFLLPPPHMNRRR
jgi:hypothetical protein